MKPITYYCDNYTTKHLSEKWGDRLEKMPFEGKLFLCTVLSNYFFFKIGMTELVDKFADTPHSKFVAEYCEELNATAYSSHSELAKILSFVADSLSEDFYQMEQKSANSSN